MDIMYKGNYIMSLKDCINRDINTVFLNTSDFCDNITIQVGTKKFNVIGSLQSNAVQNNSGNTQPLQSIGYTLYIKYPLSNDLDHTLLSSGTRITIENKSYSISSVSNEMGIATILLDSRGGR